MLKFLIFFLSFFILTKFSFDPDLGWHLAMGKRFLESGQIIRFDEYSWTMPEYRWTNSYFLYQIVTSLLFEKLGHIGTSLVFGAVATLAIWILIWGAKINYWKFLVVGLGILVASVNLGVRPHLFSFLFFAILLRIMPSKIINKWQFVPLAFIFFGIWVNWHRGFVIGLLVLATYLLIDYWRLRQKKKLKLMIAISAASILGTFLNPYGVAIWKSAVFDDLTSRENLLSIAEWQPIVIYPPYSLIYAISGLILVWMVRRKVDRDNLIWFLIAGGIFSLGFLSSNFVFYWAAIFIWLSVFYFDWQLKLGRDLLAKLPLILAGATLILVFGLNFLSNFLSAFSFSGWLEKQGYPVAAADFLADKQLSRGLYNDYGWGGYLIWQKTDLKVFIDGRMASWRGRDGAILADYLSIQKGECQAMEKYEIRLALLKKNDRAVCFEKFKKEYEDDLAKILVKEGSF